MTPDSPTRGRASALPDTALPGLLLFSLLALIPVVAGIVAVGRIDAMWAVVVTFVVLVASTIGMGFAIWRQLADDGEPDDI